MRRVSIAYRLQRAQWLLERHLHFFICKDMTMERLQRTPNGMDSGMDASRRANALRCVFAIIACAAMAGCVPGQNASLNVRAANTNPDYVHLVPITPQVIAAQKAATPPADIPPALLDYQPKSYLIGPGDTLYITVWNHPELTSPAGNQQQAAANGRVVQADGSIFYPFAGKVQAAGKTIEQLRQELAGKLATYLKNPQVDVSVINYGSQRVSLEGAFTNTGPQPIAGVPLTLGEAMGKAVVDNPNANLSDVTLTRDGQVYHLDVDRLEHEGLAKTVYLKGGDRIFLPYNSHQKVFVMGEVNRPLAVRFSSADITLTEAIGAAGGLNQVTSQGKIYVIRNTTQNGDYKATVYELDAQSAVAFALGSQFEVKPGDVVFASAAGITRWNRFMTQLLPLTSALSSTAAAQYYIQR
ncbi:MAG TPA: polysaccharide biosynthesis/export family protein [Rhodanobacteraceae bacterium]|nr:polysaccharide biosynthesis/export family protein [Rhodanobacteraceae bacterium]